MGTCHGRARRVVRPLRRVGIVLGAGLLIALGLSGVANAEQMAPGNPYFYSCGSSRLGGIHVEAAAADVRVLVQPDDGAPDQEFHRSGNVDEDFEGGSRGSALVFASNDGFFSPDIDTFCSATP